jgi:hypothetical protein
VCEGEVRHLDECCSLTAKLGVAKAVFKATLSQRRRNEVSRERKGGKCASVLQTEGYYARDGKECCGRDGAEGSAGPRPRESLNFLPCVLQRCDGWLKECAVVVSLE